MNTYHRERYFPRGYTAEEFPDCAAVVARSEPDTKGRVSAIAYAGKRNKSDWHFIFPNRERCEKCITEWLNGLRQSQERKAAACKAKAAWQHDLKVGDVLHGSWGYDQTNPEFYEVTELRGKRVVIRELCCETVEGSEGFMSCRTRPVPGSYCGPEKVKVPQCLTWDGSKTSTYVRLTDYCSLTKWEHETAYRSWYG